MWITGTFWFNLKHNTPDLSTDDTAEAPALTLTVPQLHCALLELVTVGPMAGLCVYGSDRNMNTRLILFVVARHVLSPCPASIVLLCLFWFSGLILFPHLFTFLSVLTAIFTSLKMFAFISQHNVGASRLS